MNDDDLRRRIAATDPTVGEPVPNPTDPSVRSLLEEIMSTPHDTVTTEDVAPPAEPQGRPDGGPRRWFAPIAGIVAAGALVVGGLAVGGAFDSADGEPDLATPEPLTLSLGEGQDPMASCLRVDPEVLRPVAIAFAGDVTSIDGDTVTMEVTRWFTDGDAPVVTMTAPAGLEALLGTVDFEVGRSFLVSSGDGQTVNYCGWSGPDVPELRSIYDAAFPA